MIVTCDRLDGLVHEHPRSNPDTLLHQRHGLSVPFGCIFCGRAVPMFTILSEVRVTGQLVLFPLVPRRLTTSIRALGIRDIRRGIAGRVGLVVR